MKQFLVAAVAAMSIHASSHADVMYRWTPVTDGKPANASMTLVFSDDAVANGMFNYHLAPTNTISDASGLKYFGFGINGITPMSYTPGTELFRYGMGRIDMSLNFDPAGYLTGSISANDQNSDFAMSSRGDLFAFTRMGSDQDPMGTKFTCGTYTGYACTSTGILERVSTVQATVVHTAALSADVPEPGSLTLIGAGLLGLLGLGRAKRRS
jgi:hypothetical protein